MERPVYCASAVKSVCRKSMSRRPTHTAAILEISFRIDSIYKGKIGQNRATVFDGN